MNKKIIIAVSGAAEVNHCGDDVLKSAKELGREIARQDCVLVTGATSGFPYYSAQGYKEENGYFSLGFSPATNETEHTSTYLLPLDFSDIIVYTGFGFPVRDIILTKSADAMIIGCGRIGTIHEFTVAFEANMPLGILEGPWTTDELIKDIIVKSNRINLNIVFDKDPKVLISKLKELCKQQKNKMELGDRDMVTQLKAKI